ncbi:unnamed protein product [Amoebophrya sp. A120]|nr:unnamed protein product [Amoebophrya sp. A120]|eukprot:GSA120T00022902001.1
MPEQDSVAPAGAGTIVPPAEPETGGDKVPVSEVDQAAGTVDTITTNDEAEARVASTASPTASSILTTAGTASSATTTTLLNRLKLRNLENKYTTKGMENNMQPKMSDFLEFKKEKTKLDNELAQVAAEAGPLPSLPARPTVASATTQPSSRALADDDHAMKPTTSSSTVESSDSTTSAAAGKTKATKKGSNKELLKSRTKASGEINKENSKEEQPIQPDANTILGQQAPSADQPLEKVQSEISLPEQPVAVPAASRDSFSSSAAAPAQKVIQKELTVMDLMRQQIEEGKNLKPAVVVQHPSGGSDNTGKLEGTEPEEEGKASSGPPAKKRRNKRKTTGKTSAVAGGASNGADVVQEGDQLHAGDETKDGEGSGETSAGGVQKPNDGAPPNMYQPKMTEFLDINSMMK